MDYPIDRRLKKEGENKFKTDLIPLNDLFEVDIDGNISIKDIATIQSNISALDSAVQALFAKTASDDANYDTLQEVVNQVKSLINTLNYLSYDNVRETTGIKHFTSTLQTKLNALYDQSSLQDILNGINNSITNINANITTIQGKIASDDANYDTLQEVVNQVKILSDSVLPLAIDIQTILSAYYTKTEVDNTLSMYATNIAALDSAVQALFAKTASNDSNYDTIQEIVDQVKSLISTINANSISYNNQFSNINNSITDIDNSITSINTNLTIIQNKIASDDANYDTLQEVVNQVKSLISAISDIDNSITSINTGIENVYTKIEVDNTLSNYTTNEELNNALQDLVVSTYISPQNLVSIEIISFLIQPDSYNINLKDIYRLKINGGIFVFDDNTGYATLNTWEDSSSCTFLLSNWSIDGTGKLDTGTVQEQSFYKLFAIYNPTTKNSNFIATLGTNESPTMPNGYTKKKYIGTIQTDSFTTFVSAGTFLQLKIMKYIGNQVYWGNKANSSVQISRNYIGEKNITDKLPNINCSIIAQLNWNNSLSNIGVSLLMYLNKDYLNSNNDSFYNIFNGTLGEGSTAQFTIPLDKMRLLRVITSTSSTSGDLTLNIVGYTDHDL